MQRHPKFCDFPNINTTRISSFNKSGGKQYRRKWLTKFEAIHVRIAALNILGKFKRLVNSSSGMTGKIKVECGIGVGLSFVVVEFSAVFEMKE